MSQTIFEQIVTGELASWLVWEDEAHLAFLTPFPNTRGQTVVIPKVKYGLFGPLMIFTTLAMTNPDLVRICPQQQYLFEQHHSICPTA